MNKIWRAVLFIAYRTLIVHAQGYSNNPPRLPGNMKELFSWKQLTYNIEGNSYPTERGALSSEQLSDENQCQGSLLSDRRGLPTFDTGNDLFVFPADTEDGAEAAPSSTSSPVSNNDEGTFFIQYNNVPMGVDRWKDKIFVTVPRRRHGIPATLNYLSLVDDVHTKSPGLRPYPSLKANMFKGRTESATNKPLVSVYRTRVDICDRLWMVDNGLLEVPNANQQIQPPAIVIYNLNTDRLLKRFELPSEVIVHNTTTGLASITVDVGSDGGCDDAHAYIPDLSQYGLIVYSLRKNRAWRVRHNYFYLDPRGGDYELNGLKFQWNDGIFSVISTARLGGPGKTAVFHPMSGTTEYAVPTEVLKNESLATRDYHGDDFRILGDRGMNTQTAMHDIAERSGVVLYGQVGRNAIACWNTGRPFTEGNHYTLARDDNVLIYPSDLHVDSQEEAWIMSNKLPIFNYAQLDPTDTNFRIYTFHVPTMIAGTVCDANGVRPKSHY